MKKDLLKIAAVLVLVSGAYSISLSQDMLGISNSNYAGTNSISINPASMVNSKLCMDIHLVTFNAQIQNNYVYIDKRTHSLSALFNRDIMLSSSKNSETQNEDVAVLRDNMNTKNKYLFNNITLQLPSLMLAYNRHAFAFNTSIRTAFSVRNIADHAAKFFFEGSDYKPQQGINYDFHDAEITQMTWSEISLSYAYMFSKNSGSQWAGGISLKYLMGHTAMFARGYDNNYMFIDDETLQVNNLNAEYGYALPVSSMTNDVTDDKLVRGKGFGVNLGITYQKNKNINKNMRAKQFDCNNHDNYLYKIGLSFIDIGAIKFKDEARTFKFDNVNTYWEGFDTTEVECIDSYNKTLSYKFYGDSLASKSSDKFSIALPASISLQFDYQFRPNYYINTTIIQNIKIGKFQVNRPNLISITPRYETAWFEVSLPITMYNYQIPCAGVAVRFYGITLGTDKLCGFVGLNDVYGMDFFCSVKIGFVNGTCGKKCGGSKMALLNFKKKNKRNSSKRSNGKYAYR